MNRRPNPAELALIDGRLPPAPPAPLRRFVPHEPTLKQRQFLDLTCLEALYGGAAGGGKTDALLMAAAQYVHVPGYAALILRRTYADLAKDGAIMQRAKAWWMPQGVDWSEKEKRFTFPSGASIAFGYLDSENDKYNYQGGEWQFIAFDELTQFPETWYRYLLSRLRRIRGLPVPLRVRSASNPGGIGHDWVRRRFVDVSTATSGQFVPASLSDNPYLDRTEYRAALALLDPVTRKQLEEGMWIRDGGGLVYGAYDEGRNLIEAQPPITNYLIGLDFGIVDANAVCVLGWREHDPCVYVLEAYRIKCNVTRMAEEVLALSNRYSPVTIVGDTGGMGKAFAEEIGARYGIPVDAADKNNKVGYISLLNAALSDGRIRVLPTCADLLSEWRELPWNDARTKECEGFDNHASDATLYAWRACVAYHNRPEEPKPVYGSPEFYKAQEDAYWDKKQREQTEERWY